MSMFLLFILMEVCREIILRTQLCSFIQKGCEINTKETRPKIHSNPSRCALTVFPCRIGGPAAQIEFKDQILKQQLSKM